MNTPSDNVDARFRAMLRELGPADRLAMACRMFSTGRALAIAGLRSRDGELAGPQLKRLLLRHFYGRDLTSRQLSQIETTLGQPDRPAHTAPANRPEDPDV
jgi:hypothetical protein